MTKARWSFPDIRDILPLPPPCACTLQDEFIFKVESTGVLKAESIVRQALEVIIDKINTISSAVREIQSTEE